MKTLNAHTKMLGVSATLLASVTSSLAGYSVQSQVAKSSEKIQYTWTVHNQDESWGLDQFAIDVPAQTRVLASSVPPPYANPNGNAYWVMVETREAQADPHDGRAWLPAAKPGRKWIIWEGLQSPSVYPPGSMATFSLTTDTSVKPGSVASTAASYTPQTNPHYYRTFQGKVIAPDAVNDATASNDTTEPSVQTTQSEFQSVHPARTDWTGDSKPAPNRATCRKTGVANTTYVALIRITANVDGSDRFFFAPDNVRWEHKFWGNPTDVTFDGQPWTDLNHAPAGWRDLARPLDLRGAWIVHSQGRDVVALGRTSDGFELSLCDSPGGADYYEVTIAVPLRGESLPDTALEAKAPAL